MKRSPLTVAFATLLLALPLAAGAATPNRPAPTAALSDTDSAARDKADAQQREQRDKLKAQQKEQREKLKVQQKEQREKLATEQKLQRDKMHAEQRAQWEKLRQQASADDTASGSRANVATTHR